MLSKSWILLTLLLTACASATPVSAPEHQVFVPLVGSKTQPCRDIQTTVMLRYVYEARVAGPFQVIDCMEHDKHWEMGLERGEIVQVQQHNLIHWGIAQQGDPWLQVLIWEGTIKPYTINLVLEE